MTFHPRLPAEPAASATVFDNGVLYRELSRGLYEVRQHPRDGSVYVASALASPGVTGGAIYRLDPDTLDPIGAIYTDRGNFGLALDGEANRLYSGNAVEQSLTAFDLTDHTVIERLNFEDAGPDGRKYAPRQLLLDAARGLLYVGAVGDPAVIWVVDAASLTLRHTIREVGQWATGLMLDPRTGDLVILTGGGEILIIDPSDYGVRQRLRPTAEAETLLLNMALDADSRRLYVTDHSKLQTVLIVDLDSGEKLGEIADAGESMGILLNPARREIYISHRDRGTVSIRDADTHALKRSVRAGPHPNSLALSNDGAALFVTVKTPFTSTYAASGAESIVRIPLDTEA